MGRLVIAVVEDMFFASKIRAVAEAAGVEVSFPRSKEALIEKVRTEETKLIVVDLHNQNVDAVGLATDLKADETLARIPLMGFFSHVETKLQRLALEAGYDRVIPRSAFARDLPKLLTADLHESLRTNSDPGGSV